MELTLHKSGGGKTSKVSVSDAVFGANYNETLVHQVLTTYMAGARAGSKAQKTRSEVRGGGKSHSAKKALVAQEPVPVEVHCGAVVELSLLRNHVHIARRLIKKCTVAQYGRFFQNSQDRRG